MPEEFGNGSQTSRMGLFGEPRRQRRDLVIFVGGCVVLAYILIFLSVAPYEDDGSIRFGHIAPAASLLLQGAAEFLPQVRPTLAGLLRVMSSILGLVFLVLLVLDLTY